MPSLRKLLVLIACIAMPGCATTVHSHDVRAAGDPQTQWNSFFLWGAVGEADVDVDRACGPGAKAAELGVEPTFFTVLVTVVTLGIYSPQTSFVTCGEPTTRTASTKAAVLP